MYDNAIYEVPMLITFVEEFVFYVFENFANVFKSTMIYTLLRIVFEATIADSS
jgi:hypothetical protein